VSEAADGGDLIIHPHLMNGKHATELIDFSPKLAKGNVFKLSIDKRPNKVIFLMDLTGLDLHLDQAGEVIIHRVVSWSIAREISPSSASK
jgi:hypothetical protein